MVKASPESMAPTPVKLVRKALELPRTKVAVPDGGIGGVDDEWFQLQLINPPDSADVMDSATADHNSMRMFELSFWYHQFAIVLDGEMVCQDSATGEVYRGHEGDLFHWAPGLHMRFGGRFRALGTKTPIPMRWVRTARGKEERLMHTLPDEILLEGAAPDETREVRESSPLLPSRRIKFVRGALKAEPVTVDSSVNRGGRWQRVALIDPIDTNLVGSVCIEARSGAEATRRDHRWHEVALVLDGMLTTENLATGETFHAVKGDLFYWGPGLQQGLEGDFRIFSVKTPDPEFNAYELDESSRRPGTPPDEVIEEPMREAR
jgi:quercetin dioxygenase-like cupin family protein